ncbi:hypothetical protein DEAC_c35710 [Desulfosporosinus acididurans]|uniref:Uncharacterized protein n=1 Tax=Desulfosporosinus acididurans TaxID=476652 RepID=A0A0J1FMA5_9FIRM|nr:hypothetical protein DEAC_c35710 [Desulfosporosinus acididurans]
MHWLQLPRSGHCEQVGGYKIGLFDDGVLSFNRINGMLQPPLIQNLFATIIILQMFEKAISVLKESYIFTILYNRFCLIFRVNSLNRNYCYNDRLNGLLLIKVNLRKLRARIQHMIKDNVATDRITIIPLD